MMVGLEWGMSKGMVRVSAIRMPKASGGSGVVLENGRGEVIGRDGVGRGRDVRGNGRDIGMVRSDSRGHGGSGGGNWRCRGAWWRERFKCKDSSSAF